MLALGILGLVPLTKVYLGSLELHTDTGAPWRPPPTLVPFLAANTVAGLGLLLGRRWGVIACLILAGVQLLRMVPATLLIMHDSDGFPAYLLPGLVLATAVWAGLYLPALVSARRHWAAFK
jgi:hypothetical protein